MAYVNTRVQSPRPQVSQPQTQKGWLGRAVGALKEVLSGPKLTTQAARQGQDYMVNGAPLDVNSVRRHDHLLAGRGPNNNRGLKSITVPDQALVGFLNDMSSGKYG